MNKFHSKFLLISIIILTPLVSFASVSKISFTTDAQTIKPNAISGPITIQTQDSSGQSFQTLETIDLEFISTSPTGEFLGSTGNPTTAYMSKNTANRTFYYRDSAEGVFTMTINATGRDSGGKWNVSQQITVSSGTADNDSGEVLSANTESQQSTPPSQSATSGSAAPAYSTPSNQLEVSAGGDRLTSPGSPISFQAFIKKNSASNSAVNFSWSFGDGNVGYGALVSHMYKYPGDYAVVLNAKAGNISAVSRLKVKAVEPDISISEKDGYIEISNNSNSEINLFNWKIINNSRGFVFQPDTIILPKSKIKIDDSLLTMKGEPEQNIVLKNFLGQKIVSIAGKLDGKILMQADEIQKQANSLLEKAIAANLVTEKPAPPTLLPIKTGKSSSDSAGLNKLNENYATSTTTEIIIYETPKQKNFLGRIWSYISSVFD